MSKEWDCPRCGQKTSGSYSEGGALWAICDSCMIKEIESYRLAEVEKKEKEEIKNVE